MNKNFAIISQIIRNIEFEITQNRLTEAHQLCLNALRGFPGEKRLMTLKMEIEKEVELRNKEILKKQISEIKTIWKTKDDILEVIRRIKQLQQIHQNNKELKKLYKKAQSAYEKKIAEMLKNYIKKEKAEIEILIEKSLDEAFQKIVNLEKVNYANQLIPEITKQYREEILKKKIAQKKDLLASAKFNDIQHFLEEISKINPQSITYKKLVEHTQHRILQNQKRERKEYFYIEENYFDTLIKLKKYDKALQIANEALLENPESKILKAQIQKAEKFLFRETREECCNKITKEQNFTKESFAKNPKSYIKLFI